MKNAMKTIAFLLVAILVSQCNVKNPEPATEKGQVVYAAQLYMSALKKQQKASLSSLFASLDSIRQQMTSPRANVAALGQVLQTVQQDFKVKLEKMAAQNQQMDEAMYAAVGGRKVPPPPPPPGPCNGCEKLLLLRNESIILYHTNALQANILDRQGKVMITAMSAPADAAIGGLTKTVLDLKGLNLTDNMTLNIEGPDGAANIEIAFEKM